jgi:hypothetical protein
VDELEEARGGYKPRWKKDLILIKILMFYFFDGVDKMS